MAGAFPRTFCVFVVLVATFFVPAQGHYNHHKCPSGFANFGDSLTDTGSALDAFPGVPPLFSLVEKYPYGETFFGRPAKRFSNGRVTADFLSLAFKKPLLDAYFAITATDYSTGVNFAVAGATAAPAKNALVPFTLPVQVNQFIRFKNSAKAVGAQKSCANLLSGLPSKSAYSKWLYVVEIGGNDIFGALRDPTLTPADILNTTIPQSVGNINASIRTLYAESARRFLISGIPPQGCAPLIATLLEGVPGVATDSFGCVLSVNQLSAAFNALLFAVIKELRTDLPDVSISFFDYYAANYEILYNASYYGFDQSKVLTACCGHPGNGTYNYNANIPCASPGSNNCANPEAYVNWDGIHFTDHFYRVISEFILAGKFTDSPVDFSKCDLDFSNFGPKATYEKVYPNRCENLYD